MQLRALCTVTAALALVCSFSVVAEQSTQEKVKARWIIIAYKGSWLDGVVKKPLSEKDAQAKAESIRQQLLNGASFEELAKKESNDPIAATKGGDLSTFGRGEMIPEVDQAAFAMKPGEISDVIRTKMGFIILKVESHETVTVEAPPPIDSKPVAVDGARLRERLSALMRPGAPRDFVLCNLEPALWGGHYSASVQIAGRYLNDGRGRVLTTADGQLSEAEKSDAHSISSKREGKVVIDSPEEAFARGLPFFVKDVTWNERDGVHFTAVSNPKVTITGAMGHLVTVKNEEGFVSSMDVSDEPRKFNSAQAPQARIMKVDVTGKEVFSLVTLTGNSNPCLVSNEVELASATHQ